MFKVGDRVNVNVDNGAVQLKDAPATIVFIDKALLYAHEFVPVQVELDEPYDESEHKTYRVTVKQITRRNEQ